MASKSITNRTKAARVEPTATSAPPEFFTNNGKYQVAPGTTGNQLHEDIGCWLGVINGIVGALIHSMEVDNEGKTDVCQTLYGVQYLVEMVQGALLASYKLDNPGGAA